MVPKCVCVCLTIQSHSKYSHFPLLNCYLHFSLAISWALKFCIISPLESIQQDLKFIVNVSKVNTVNKSLYCKFLESIETNGMQRTVLKLSGQQKIIQVPDYVFLTSPFQEVVKFIILPHLFKEKFCKIAVKYTCLICTTVKEMLLV